MRNILYFPLHVVILLWFQSRRVESNDTRVASHFLAIRRGFLEAVLDELENTQSGSIRQWLIDFVVKELDAVMLLQSIGLVDSGYVLKK